MSQQRSIAPATDTTEPQTLGLLRPFGKLRWPWRIATTTCARRPPLIAWNTYPRQVIGIHLRLPDGTVGGRTTHHGLSILWARPDVRAYPTDWADPGYKNRHEAWR